MSDVDVRIDEFLRELGYDPDAVTRTSSVPTWSPDLEIADDERVRRARAYIARIPGAVSGANGHSATFHAACVLVKDFALSEADAFDVLSEWNSTCEPPWSDRELRHKIESALKADGAVGAKLLPTIERREFKVSQVKSTAEHTERQEPKKPRMFVGVDAADLEPLLSEKPDWLVQGVFACGETLVLAARSKACKTLQLCDLAVALATGGKWMGHFDVPQSRRVLFISGETNRRRMAAHLLPALRGRDETFESLRGWLRVETEAFPTLASFSDLAGVRATVAEYQPNVVICDPLYRGLSGLDSTRLAEMGPALKQLEDACKPATLILSHHVTKSAARDEGAAPSLEDMSGAGLAEMAGQWWLVGRNAKYAFDGTHDLAVHYGGREGQAGGLRILFDERAWTWDVQSLAEFRVEAAEQGRAVRERARQQEHQRAIEDARRRILNTFRTRREPMSKAMIKECGGLKRATFDEAIGDMLRDETLVMRPYTDGLGRRQTGGIIWREIVDEWDRKANGEDVC